MTFDPRSFPYGMSLMYFTIIFMKEDSPAVFHIIVTHLGWGLFSGLNARSPLMSFKPTMITLTYRHHGKTKKKKKKKTKKKKKKKKKKMII